jgi:hypothetical protein
LQLSAIGTTDLLVAKVFNEPQQEYLEANFDHDPAAAIAWMAASSQASFGYKNCPMDEQLEAVLGTDCSKVLLQGTRERILNDMKEAMDCRHIQSCAACGFRGYQLGSRMNVDTDLQWLEMSAEALSHFQAKSLLYQQVSSSVLRSGKRYHLHQELVAADGSTWICDDCNKGAQGCKLNPMSLKAGVDYGRLSRAPGLSKLTMVEQALVANNRFYATTLVPESPAAHGNQSTAVLSEAVEETVDVSSDTSEVPESPSCIETSVTRRRYLNRQ